MQGNKQEFQNLKDKSPEYQTHQQKVGVEKHSRACTRSCIPETGNKIN